jgi:hypothetical protein
VQTGPPKVVLCSLTERASSPFDAEPPGSIHSDGPISVGDGISFGQGPTQHDITATIETVNPYLPGSKQLYFGARKKLARLWRISPSAVGPIRIQSPCLACKEQVKYWSFWFGAAQFWYVRADHRGPRSQIFASSTCLVCASFGWSDSEKADSARRCRFRKSQQKRASDFRSNIRLDSQAGRHSSVIAQLGLARSRNVFSSHPAPVAGADAWLYCPIWNRLGAHTGPTGE